MHKKSRLKVGLTSSTGGHFLELQKLFPIMEAHDLFVVTEKNIVTDNLASRYRTYYLLQQDRKNVTFVWRFFINVVRALTVLAKEKPDVIISTGAGATVPFCLFGKIFGAKVIFIESFSKITTPTLTGRIVYRFADKMYVQWGSMLKHYPKAEYKGGIY